MKKYKHKIYVTICPKCKKLICCYRFSRWKKILGKHPYCHCKEHSLWKSTIITENDFVNISSLFPDINNIISD